MPPYLHALLKRPGVLDEVVVAPRVEPRARVRPGPGRLVVVQEPHVLRVGRDHHRLHGEEPGVDRGLGLGEERLVPLGQREEHEVVHHQEQDGVVSELVEWFELRPVARQDLSAHETSPPFAPVLLKGLKQEELFGGNGPSELP